MPVKNSVSSNITPVSFCRLRLTSSKVISKTLVSPSRTPSPVGLSTSSPSKSKASVKPEIRTLLKIALVPALSLIASLSFVEPFPFIVKLLMVAADQNNGLELFPMSVLKPSASIPLS